MKRLIALLIAAVPAFAGYGYEQVFTIPANTAGTETGFPLLISGTYAAFATSANGGQVLNTTACCAGGIAVPADLAFSSTDCARPTLLSWEFEKYDATSGATVAWVKRTLSQSSSTPVYACIGNASVTTYQGNAPAVWSDYVAVYHLASMTVDSTGNYPATDVNCVAGSGEIGGGATSNGANSCIQVPSLSAAVAGAQLTVEAWMKDLCGWNCYSPNIGNDGAYFSGRGLLLSLTPGGVSVQVGISGGSRIDESASLPTSTWYSVAFTYSGSEGAIYRNGTVQASSSLPGAVAASPNPMYFGNLGNGTYPQLALDEVRFSAVARSADWIATEYANQSSPSTFYSVGTLTAVTPVASSPAGFAIMM